MGPPFLTHGVRLFVLVVVFETSSVNKSVYKGPEKPFVGFFEAFLFCMCRNVVFLPAASGQRAIRVTFQGPFI